MSEKLKPCPFCGSKAMIETFTTACEKVPRYRVRCEDCFCQTSWDYFEIDEVVKDWNRRAEQ